MKLVDADDMFEYMKSEDGAIQLGHSPVRFLDVKRVIESVPTIDAIPVEWFYEFIRSAGMQGQIGVVQAFMYVLDTWKATREEWEAKHGGELECLTTS